jgi:hypothetical protein
LPSLAQGLNLRDIEEDIMSKMKKGLGMGLLLMGLVLVLAAMAPGAWATPHQSPLRQTLPAGDVLATDENGVEKNLFGTNEPVGVSVKNGSFTPGSQVDVYVVIDDLWFEGKAITQDRSGGVDTLVANANGAFGPPTPIVWPIPTFPGEYDIVCDANQNGLFDAGDGVDDAIVGTGFVVQAVAVGGITIPVSKVGLAAPWIGLAAMMGVAVGAAMVIRRRGEV